MEPSRPRPLFFDDLPKEVLVDMIELVLKSSSRLPNNSNWENHISLSDVTKLFGVKGGGDFRAALKGRFKTLCISNFNNCQRESDDYKWKVKDGPMLWTNDINTAHAFVTAGGGQSLQNIIIGINMYDPHFHGIGMANDFLEHCPKVTALSIVEEEPVWISRFGAKLDSLEISTGDHLNIPKYCHQLKHLTFHSYRPWNPYLSALHSLSLCGNSAATLQSLTVTGFYLPVEQILDIETRCRNLKRVRIQAIKDDEKLAVANLLASYGDGLEWAYVRDLSTAQLQRVVDSCENARFHLNIVNYDTGLTAISIIADKLQSLSVNVGAYDGALPAFGPAWLTCGNLEELNIVGCRNEHMQAIMAAPKHKLKALNITIFESAREFDVRNIMESCAAGTCALEKLVFNACRMPTDALDKLVKNNKSLANVVLLYDTKIVVKMTEILNSCIKSPSLSEITYTDFTSRAIAAKYHHRGVHRRNRFGTNFYHEDQGPYR